jgi:hypothetical protein
MRAAARASEARSAGTVRRLEQWKPARASLTGSTVGLDAQHDSAVRRNQPRPRRPL